jgi:hypothetical protein
VLGLGGDEAAVREATQGGEQIGLADAQGNADGFGACRRGVAWRCSTTRARSGSSAACRHRPLPLPGSRGAGVAGTRGRRNGDGAGALRCSTMGTRSSPWRVSDPWVESLAVPEFRSPIREPGPGPDCESLVLGVSRRVAGTAGPLAGTARHHWRPQRSRLLLVRAAPTGIVLPRRALASPYAAGQSRTAGQSQTL